MKLIYPHSTDRVVTGGPYALLLYENNGEQVILGQSFSTREEAISFVKTKTTRKALLKAGKWKQFNVIDMRELSGGGVVNFETKEEAEAFSQTKQ